MVQMRLTIGKSLNLVFRPRVDGRLLTDNPQRLLVQGHISEIPFINGQSIHHWFLVTSVVDGTVQGIMMMRERKSR
jgi:hypothetical protein